MDMVLYGLAGFVILGSIAALEMKSLLSAVIAMGVVGLGLSILFLLLAAPDIAITMVVVEVIVVTVLIRAAGRVPIETPAMRGGRVRVLAGAGFSLVVIGLLIAAFETLPAFGERAFAPALWYLEHGPELTGATNIVTAILLDFRAYDTLGEATVILTAVVGALAVLRRPARRKEGGDV